MKNLRLEVIAITWEHILARTLVRWLPDIYQAYLDAVAVYTGKKYDFKPYVIGQPLRPVPPTHKEQIDILTNWNGNYKMFIK